MQYLLWHVTNRTATKVWEVTGHGKDGAPAQPHT